jgi:hypothetical protein
LRLMAHRSCTCRREEAYRHRPSSTTHYGSSRRTWSEPETLGASAPSAAQYLCRHDHLSRTKRIESRGSPRCYTRTQPSSRFAFRLAHAELHRPGAEAGKAAPSLTRPDNAPPAHRERCPPQMLKSRCGPRSIKYRLRRRVCVNGAVAAAENLKRRCRNMDL